MCLSSGISPFGHSFEWPSRRFNNSVNQLQTQHLALPSESIAIRRALGCERAFSSTQPRDSQVSGRRLEKIQGTGEINMEMKSNVVTAAPEGLMGERLLWTAVLKLAVDDWRLGNLRQRREAQKFLFDEQENLTRVCAAAGLEPETFRCQCLKIGQKIAMRGCWQPPLAA
jgi:hypothetical protein